MLRFVPWILASTLFLLLPKPSLGADIDVSFEEIAVLDGRGLGKTEFLPGEEMQVRVRLRVLRSTENPYVVRLRITGDGWHEIQTSPPLFGSGTRVIPFGGSEPGLFAGAEAGPGKVSLLLDVFSEQETVSLNGRRHEYLTIRCPEGSPAGITARFQVGVNPVDMALTADARYLYVTSREDRNVTVIDAETKTIAAVIEDPETIGLPMGVAPSPGGQAMLVADAGYEVVHVIDADTHVLLDTIPLNANFELGSNSLGDLAVNPARNEAYITDSRGLRIVVLELASLEIRTLSLVGPPPLGAGPAQVMLDPEDSRFIYVLCGGLNEVVKLNVTGGIVDFVRLRNIQDLSSLWPVWSMALNPTTDEIYVVANPGGTEEPEPTLESKIYVLPKNGLSAPGRRELFVGTSVWDLVPRGDGRFAYGIDSFRGEILVIDMNTGTDMTRCAIPVDAGGRHLRADFTRNRLFVGGWLPGFVHIVE